MVAGGRPLGDRLRGKGHEREKRLGMEVKPGIIWKAATGGEEKRKMKKKNIFKDKKGRG